MPLENRISLNLTEEALTEVLSLARELDAKLKPFLIALTSDERQVLPKMSDGNLPFVEKSLEFAGSNPDFAPRFLNLQEFKTDLDAVKKLLPVSTLLNQLQSNLRDTMTLAGSEAFVASLSYYQGVKHAAQVNEPGAKPLYDELHKRFKGQSTSGTNKEKAS